MPANPNCACSSCARNHMNFSSGVGVVDRIQPEAFEFIGKDEFEEAWPDELETIASLSPLNILSSSELKAVKITSTFETGRAGGFGGLTGNFDGQGLSFGLMNFTIKAGSLIPLLKDFISNHSARYSGIFGNEALRFKEIVFATRADNKNPKIQVRDIARQMQFVNSQMNTFPSKHKHNKIIEPWKTYFGLLEKDTEFQRIQVKAVQRALQSAQKWYRCFGFKTERGFAFMFDLVSSHGAAWLNAKKFNKKRILLLQKMLAAKQVQLGRKNLTELEKMEVIANMIADVSLPEWQHAARIRKLWFVRGAGKLHGSYYDIKKTFGITDTPAIFTQAVNEATCITRDWEFESATPTFEYENEWPEHLEMEQASSPAVPVLLSKEVSPQEQTLYVKIGIEKAPNRSTKKLYNLPAKTGIFLPKTFTPTSSIDLIIYFHGLKNPDPGNCVSIDEYWNQKLHPHLALREEINKSERNVIFVAPDLGDNAEGGQLATPNGFDEYIKQVLAAVNEHYVIPRYRRSLNSIGNIILAAHSKGGRAMLNIANLPDKYSANIKECWCFDSMYGDVAERWANWANAHPQSTLFVYAGPAKRNKNIPKDPIKPKDNAENLDRQKNKRKLSNVCIQDSRAKSHMQVPIVHLKERLLNSPCLQNAVAAQRRKKFEYEAGRAKTEDKRDDQGQSHVTNLEFMAKAIAMNVASRQNLAWVFSGKKERGWSLYWPLIAQLLRFDGSADSEDFVTYLSRWQAQTHLLPTGVLDQKTLMKMISHWLARRSKNYATPSPEKLVTVNAIAFYEKRSAELRRVERDTYDAYKKMVAAAAKDLALPVATDGSLKTEYFKIISAFRTPEYQAGLHKKNPQAGTSQLAKTSPHFTGRALDLYVGGHPTSTKDSNRAIQINTKVYQWLVKNAEKFGFLPYFYEPWHWESNPAVLSK